MSGDTYGELLADAVDRACQYEERADVFRRSGIKKGHYYNVINPDRKSTSGDPFHCPTEWVVAVTNLSKDFTVIKAISKDCGCILLTPEDLEELNGAENPEKTLNMFIKIIGKAKKQ